MTKRKRFDPEEVTRGRRHELEHVDDESFAQIIAEDHLAEDPQYYTHLEACMPTCSSCRPKENPGFVRTAADERLWERAKDAAAKSYRVGSKSYWRAANFIFHRMKEAPRRNPPRLVRDATADEKREYLHQNVDELLYPRSVRRQADVAALRRVAEDTDDLSALDDLLSDPSLADDFEWLVPGLVDSLHSQVSKASRSQIDMYTGPFFRVRRGR